MKNLNGPLSTVASQRDGSAWVEFIEELREDGRQILPGRFVLHTNNFNTADGKEELVGLGNRFSDARLAVLSWVRQARSQKEKI